MINTDEIPNEQQLDVLEAMQLKDNRLESHREPYHKASYGLYTHPITVKPTKELTEPFVQRLVARKWIEGVPQDQLWDHVHFHLTPHGEQAIILGRAHAIRSKKRKSVRGAR